MRRAVVLIAVLLLAPLPLRAVWVVDGNGQCVEQWTAADLLAGPTAIVNAPLLPFRSLAGGAQYAWNVEEWWPYQIAILGPAVTLFSGAFGVVEAAWWIGTGVADTVTGGYFAISPERATELSLAPDVPIVIADAAPATAATDRCGRRTAATPAAGVE